MVWESTLTCFSTGSFADIECIIGSGLLSIFGNPIYLTLISMVFFVALAWKLKLPLDLTAIFLLGIVSVFTLTFVEQWVQWLIIIFLAIGAAYGLYKFIKR